LAVPERRNKKIPINPIVESFLDKRLEQCILFSF